MAREIPLSRGKVALVDDVDFDRVGGLRWTAKPADQATEKWYAYRTEVRDGRKATIYLHRLITLAPAHLLVDHRNGDGLDCRRENLRLCSHSENLINRHLPRPAGGYRGIHLTPAGKWRVLVQCQGQVIRLTPVNDPALAARLYDAVAAVVHGEFAVLNFRKSERTA